MADDDRSDEVRRLIDAGRDREAARQGAASGDVGIGSQDGHGPGGAPMDPLDQLDRLGGPLGGVVAAITPDQLDNPTPCAQFTVRGVLEHMIGGATMFTAAFRGEAPGVPALDDVLAGFQPTLGTLVAAMQAPGALDKTIEAPFGEVSGEAFARFVVLDGLVHGWDLAVATGQPYAPPDDLVAEADAFAHQTLDALRDGDTFADAVEPPAGASPIERLAAYTGRRRP